MKTQHQVVLSLGSNQGNRLENIERALALIHQEIGTVIKVSRLYETPSWGFDSDAFLNGALLIHSYKTPLEILDLVLKIEKRLGRIRTKSKEYQSRIIDIDIITYNEEIINTPTLQIPHPFLQDRNFVLLPMLDLQIEWKHPVLQKNISEILELASDHSVCKAIKELKTPLDSRLLSQFNYIAIEGNIGAGKTTLGIKMAEDFNANTVMERFVDNLFLPKFYKDPNRYAFPLEMSFLADRHQQLTSDLAFFNLTSDFVIADYHIFKSLIFAKITLDLDEYQLYHNLFDIMYKEMPKPDLYIYLYQSTPILLENIKQRGRSYEQNITADYLDKINKGYLEYIESQTDLNVVIIDVSGKNFVNNQEDYIFILDEIAKKTKSLI
jgi:deoxyguanosine kinase